MKQIRYILEAIMIHLAFLVFWLIGPRAASATGGFLGRIIGPRLAASRKARRHIQNALPDIKDIDAVIHGMWDNLGRTFAEYPHIKKLASAKHTEIVGAEHLPKDGKAILITGHLGNWEVGGPSLFVQKNIPVAPVYRAPNNPYVSNLLNRCRTVTENLPLLPKSRAGARKLVEEVRKGQTVGILIDQKYNEGVAIPFFGQDAMTSPAFVQLAQKYDRPLVPIRQERLDGPTFRVTLFPALDINDRALEDIMREAHIHLEEWITDKPALWLWLHRRWVKG